MSRFIAGILFLALLIALGSCKDSTSPPVPTTLTVSAPSTTLDALGQTVQLTAQVKDKKGRAMSGIPITWSSSSASVASVSSSGLVTAVGQGSATITAAAESARGSVSLTVTQVPASLAKLRGDTQQGSVGEALSQDPAVRVLDSRGNAIPGVTVAFSVTAGGGSVSTGMVTCDTGGEAEVVWTLGTDASVGQSLSASAGNISTEFSASAAPGPAAALVVERGNGQTGVALAPLEQGIAVSISDQYGNPVSGIEVEWSAASGSGKVAPAAGTTGSDGTTEGTWTLGPTVGAQQAMAVVEGVGSVSFTASASAPPIAQITLLPQNPFLDVGGFAQLGASAFTAEGVQLLGVIFTWMSSDPSVVSVDQSGTITGLQAGTATVSAGYGGAVGSTTVSVSATPQETGVRIEVPSSALTGQTVQAELILNTWGVPHGVGAVEVTVEWDLGVLALGDWGGFLCDYWWEAVKWTSSGRLRIVVSVPAGLTGEVTILKIPLRVTGISGSGTDLSVSVDRAISALTFLEIGDSLPGISARLEVS